MVASLEVPHLLGIQVDHDYMDPEDIQAERVGSQAGEGILAQGSHQAKDSRPEVGTLELAAGRLASARPSLSASL